MLAWLCVWSEVQTCIWPSWCHYHSLSLASVKSRLVLHFWYRLTWVVPEKGPINGCVCVCVLNSSIVYLNWFYCFVYAVTLEDVESIYDPLQSVIDWSIDWIIDSLWMCKCSDVGGRWGFIWSSAVGETWTCIQRWCLPAAQVGSYQS